MNLLSRIALIMLLPALMSCGSTSQPAGEAFTETTAALSGEDSFMACEGCHSLGEGEPHGVGPNLYGLEGRVAASLEDFAWSPALQASGITWDESTLTAWIMSPEGMVEGTWMLYYNHLEVEEVQSLVGYILRQE